MGHGAHKTGGSAARQACVRVQGNDVTHSGNRFRRKAFDRYEGGARRAAEELIELVKFSALTFPSHPFLFAFIPHALTMEQKEAVASAWWRTVAPV